MNTKRPETQHLHIEIDKALMAQVTKYQHRQELATRTEALEQLLAIALKLTLAKDGKR